MRDNPRIRIGHLKIVDHLILGLASLQMEKNAPLLTHSILEPIVMNSWSQVCDGLTSGDISGAFIPAPMAMDLFANGLDIRILMFTHRSGSVIVKKKSSGIHGLAGFKGKTVLVPSELSIQNMLLHRLFSAAGITYGVHDDITADVVREVASPCLMGEMLMNDDDQDIAGFAVEEPFGSGAVQKGIATPYCTTGSLWKDHPCCVFVLKTAFTEHYSKAVKEIISLFAQTGHRLETSKDDATLSLARHFLGIDKDLIHHVLLEADIRFDPSLLIPDTATLNLIQDYMADTMGVIKNKIDVHRLVDGSFISHTLSETAH